jgi:acetyl-CoA acetyltransferase
MARHPLHDVAIVGIYNTHQARMLPGETSLSISIDAAKGAMADAGLDPADIDGVVDGAQVGLPYELGMGPVWRGMERTGCAMVMEAAGAILAGQCHTVLCCGGIAGIYTERASTAPWTRPNNQFVATWGLFTAAEFALIARRHMEMHGTKPEHLATVAATIRNNGHVHPGAVYYGRGPFTVDDVLASRMIADPFHLLDCSTTAEGGCAIILTTAERARDLRKKPVYILGGSTDTYGPSYQHPPSFDLMGRDPDIPNGYVGRRAAQRSFGLAGITAEDVDVCEFYDPFSFEIIRQFEAFGFCKEGEGGEFVMGGTIEVGGKYPIVTDGGTMSFSHTGPIVQMMQRVARGAEQLRGECVSQQVEGAEIALCTNGGAGALFTDVIVLGADQP